jgi:hypothetical protein
VLKAYVEMRAKYSVLMPAPLLTAPPIHWRSQGRGLKLR